MPRSEVLVVGAEPSGLVLALWPTKLGMKPRIIDKLALHPSQHGKSENRRFGTPKSNRTKLIPL